MKTTGTEMLAWDDLRRPLAVARHGCLTAAAKDLRVAQFTMGRGLAAMKEDFAVRLLHGIRTAIA